MLKPPFQFRAFLRFLQPPLGGCVLKLSVNSLLVERKGQPPLGGCVLKQSFADTAKVGDVQPPLGGCVLKLQGIQND